MGGPAETDTEQDQGSQGANVSGYEKKDGDMILFRNNKRKDDTHPVMRGELLLNGVTYETSLWPKKDRNGEPFWVGSAKVKQARSGAPRVETTKAQTESFDDTIPF
jgi:hypothetical protein